MSDTSFNPSMSGPFPIQPSGPTTFHIVSATNAAGKWLVISIATPHVAANYWITHDDWEQLVRVGNAAKTGLILPSNGQG